METVAPPDLERQSLPLPEAPTGPFEDAQRQAFFAQYQAQQADARESELNELSKQKDGKEKVQQIRRSMALKQNTLHNMGLAAGQTAGVVRSAGNMEGDWMVSEITKLGNRNPTIELVKFPADHPDTGHVNKLAVPYELLKYWQSDEAKRKYLSMPAQEPPGSGGTEQGVIGIEGDGNSGETVIGESNIAFSGLSSMLSGLRPVSGETTDPRRLQERIARSQSVVGKLEEEREILGGAVESLRRGKSPSSGSRPHSRRQQRAVGKASRHLLAAQQAKSERRRRQQVYGAEHDASHPLRPRPIDQDVVSPTDRGSKKTSDLGTDVQGERLSSGQYTRVEKRAERKAARKSKKETRKYHKHMKKAEGIADRGPGARIRNFRIKSHQRRIKKDQELLQQIGELSETEEHEQQQKSSKPVTKWRRDRAVRRTKKHIDKALNQQAGTRAHNRAVKRAQRSGQRAEKLHTKLQDNQSS